MCLCWIGSVHHFGSAHGDSENMVKDVVVNHQAAAEEDDYDGVWSALVLVFAYNVNTSTFISTDEVEEGVARNPLQQKKGFEEVSNHDDHDGVEMGTGAALANPPAYGDSDNLF